MASTDGLQNPIGFTIMVDQIKQGIDQDPFENEVRINGATLKVGFDFQWWKPPNQDNASALTENLWHDGCWMYPLHDEEQAQHNSCDLAVVYQHSATMGWMQIGTWVAQCGVDSTMSVTEPRLTKSTSLPKPRPCLQCNDFVVGNFTNTNVMPCTCVNCMLRTTGAIYSYRSLCHI
jgi:hypothetical protein